MKQCKPSEMIEEFLAFLESANSEYIECGKIVDVCEKRNIDYLHDMEFAKDKGERNRIATKIHQNQKSEGLQKIERWSWRKRLLSLQTVETKLFSGN